MKKLIFIILVVVLAFGWFSISGPTVEDSIVRENVVGIWKSLDDPMSSVTYNNNGTYREVYNGEEMRNGSWEMEDNILRTLVVDQETMEYVVLEATGEILILSYTARGNTLRYERDHTSFEPAE